MDSVNRTLYIPLYGKAYVSKKGLFLCDKNAEQIWAQEGFALKGKSASKWLAFYMGIRSAVFDEWLKERMAEKPDAAVIHLGCGLDSRVLRVGTSRHKWYDVDFPDVIKERRKYFSESEVYSMIGADIRSIDLSGYISEKKSAIVVMEGISMYLKAEEMCYITESLCKHFDELSLLSDCYTNFAVRMSARRNPAIDVGITEVYGIDNPEDFQNGDFVFVKEHEMIPEKYIEELEGTKRIIFRKLYAGNISKKLYKLYEYKKK